jgi:hypothetical protein
VCPTPVTPYSISAACIQLAHEREVAWFQQLFGSETAPTLRPVIPADCPPPTTPYAISADCRLRLTR